MLAHALAVHQGGHAQHLAHARATAGPFVADDQHIPSLVLLGRHGGVSVFFVFKHPCRAFKNQFFQARHFDQGAVWRQVAFEHHHAARGHDGVGGGAHHLAVGRWGVRQFFGQRAARQGEGLAMQVTAVEQGLEHRPGAADPVQVHRQKSPAGLQIGNQRGARKHLGHIVQGESNARFVGNGG